MASITFEFLHDDDEGDRKDDDGEANLLQGNDSYFT